MQEGDPGRAIVSRRAALASGGTGTLAALAALSGIRPALAQEATPGARAGTDLAANKELVIQFYDAFYGARESGDLDAIDAFVAEDYIQHEAGVGPGRAGLKDLLREMATYPPRPAPDLLHLVAEGDIVIAHQVRPGATPDDPPLAEGVDIFRIANGQLVEHWGISIAYPPPDATPAAG